MEHNKLFNKTLTKIIAWAYMFWLNFKKVRKNIIKALIVLKITLIRVIICCFSFHSKMERGKRHPPHGKKSAKWKESHSFRKGPFHSNWQNKDYFSFHWNGHYVASLIQTYQPNWSVEYVRHNFNNNAMRTSLPTKAVVMLHLCLQTY